MPVARTERLSERDHSGVGEGPGHKFGWLSYDSVAETYDRVAVPGFRPMASDLISAVRLPSGARVLDVGTGTGLTAELAKVSLGPTGLVVAIDPLIGMLSLARDLDRVALGVAAIAPGLPFSGGTFDAVLPIWSSPTSPTSNED